MGVTASVFRGRGVIVAVGGNQTMVAVGVSAGGDGVELGKGGKGVEIGRQALSQAPARRRMIKPLGNMCLVYYEIEWF